MGEVVYLKPKPKPVYVGKQLNDDLAATIGMMRMNLALLRALLELVDSVDSEITLSKQACKKFMQIVDKMEAYTQNNLAVKDEPV